MTLAETLKEIRPLDCSIESAAQQRLDSLTKPLGSLGKLEDIARRIAVIQGRVPPRPGRKVLFVFAADHGITEEGVSAYPREVTAQMTYNFLAGGAAINVLASHHGVETEIVDVGVDHDFTGTLGLRHHKIRRGTGNFAHGPAMTYEEAARSVELGIQLAEEVARENVFILSAGDMGIGNTSSAAAILCAISGAAPVHVVGRGTGIDDATLARKISAIETALETNRPDVHDALDVLAKIGGLEIGAITGMILGAAARRIPMVLDGYVAGAAALLAQGFSPHVRDILFASHLSAEKGHRQMLEQLELTPIFNLSLRLGEGTGACILMGVIEAAVKIMGEMATFKAAGVEERFA
jgi:nicotinate-nucleotide--dimethylbenzimidazole phosphoribosyltransferase